MFYQSIVGDLLCIYPVLQVEGIGGHEAWRPRPKCEAESDHPKNRSLVFVDERT